MIVVFASRAKQISLGRLKHSLAARKTKRFVFCSSYCWKKLFHARAFVLVSTNNFVLHFNTYMVNCLAVFELPEREVGGLNPQLFFQPP